MAKIAVERTLGNTKKAVLGGLIGYNTEKMGKQKYKRLSFSGWSRSFAARTMGRG